MRRSPSGALPLIVFPAEFLEALGFPPRPSFMFVRMLGWAGLTSHFAWGMRSASGFSSRRSRRCSDLGRHRQQRWCVRRSRCFGCMGAWAPAAHSFHPCCGHPLPRRQRSRGGSINSDSVPVKPVNVSPAMHGTAGTPGWTDDALSPRNALGERGHGLASTDERESRRRVSPGARRAIYCGGEGPPPSRRSRRRAGPDRGTAHSTN